MAKTETAETPHQAVEARLQKARSCIDFCDDQLPQADASYRATLLQFRTEVVEYHLSLTDALHTLSDPTASDLAHSMAFDLVWNS